MKEYWEEGSFRRVRTVEIGAVGFFITSQPEMLDSRSKDSSMSMIEPRTAELESRVECEKIIAASLKLKPMPPLRAKFASIRQVSQVTVLDYVA